MTLKIASYMIPVFIIVSLFLNRSCAPLVVGAAAGAELSYNMGELKTTDEVSLIVPGSPVRPCGCHGISCHQSGT